MEEIKPIDPRAGENYLCQVQEPPELQLQPKLFHWRFLPPNWRDLPV